MSNPNFVVKNGLTVNGSFTANSTAVNASAVTATSVNAASIFVNGTNVNTMISGNASTAYTNATGFASNATNITTGTLADARLSANYSTGTALTANSSSYLGTQPAANFVNTSQLSSNLANYAALSGAVFTGQVNTTTFNASGNAVIGGTLVVSGNLYVNSNTFLVNATSITTNDKTIYLANNQGTSALTDGSGFYVGNSLTPIASFLYNNSTTSFQTNVALTPAANNTSLGGASNLWNLYANQITGTLTTVSQPNITANNSSYLGGTAASGYQTTAGLSANVATLTANNSTNFAGQAASYYVSNTYMQGLGYANSTYTGTVNGAVHQTGGGIGAVANGVYANATIIFIGNSSVNATINSTAFTGAANNSSYLGGTAASGYQTTAGLSANVATLSANAATYATSSSTNAFTIGTAAYHVANGNMGIGTNAPGYILDIVQNANSIFYSRLYNSNTGISSGSGHNYIAGAQQAVTYISQAGMEVGTISAAPIYVVANNVTTMFIAANNNVGIGTSTPGYKLEVNGSAKVGTGGLTFSSGATQYNAGMAWLGTYSASTTYKPNDVVFYAGINYSGLYIARTTTLNNTPTDGGTSTYWAVMIFFNTTSAGGGGGGGGEGPSG